MKTTKISKATKAVDWRAEFKAAIERAAAKCGSDISNLKWEDCSTDRTWGDRCGLVFFGAADDVNERAAKYFEKWAHKHLRAMGVVGSYNAQASISYAGEMYYSKCENGAGGWYPEGTDKVDLAAKTITTNYGSVSHAIEMRLGFATSYVYFPCAE